MKKNRMMRLASGLLVAVLATTSMISGTYAKYVTSGEATDSARVAKWGVTVTANGETFAKEYAKDDVSFVLDANTVVSTEKVVAPGTKGDMVSMQLSGTPEVASRVSYVADVAISSNWIAGGNFYFPIIITINGTQYSADGTGCADAAAFEAYLEAKIAEYSCDYEAGIDLSTVGTDSLAISWEWPFSTSDANDVKDTELGNQAVVGNAATLGITVTTTVTQID